MFLTFFFLCCALHGLSHGAACPKKFQPPDLPTPLPTSVTDDLSTWDKGLAGLNFTFPYGIGITVAYKGKTLLTKSYGSLYTDTSKFFRIGSVTKVFTAVQTFQMAEMGIIDLDKPISHYIKDVVFSTEALPNDRHRQPTIREIVSQMSGLPREAPCPQGSGCNLTNAEMAKRLRDDLWLILPPGEQPSYSNLGFGVLGNYLSQIGQTTFADYLQEKILNPLGMTNSGIVYTPEIIQNLAGWSNSANYTLWNSGWVAPAGDMYTTLDDIAKFHHALRGNCSKVFKYVETCNDFLQTSWAAKDLTYFQGLPFEDTMLPSIHSLLVSKGGSIPIDETNIIRSVTSFNMFKGLDLTWSSFLVGNLKDLESARFGTSNVNSGVNPLLSTLYKFATTNPQLPPLPPSPILKKLIGQYVDPSSTPTNTVTRCVSLDGGQLKLGPKQFKDNLVPFEFRRALKNGNILTVVPYYSPSASCRDDVLYAVDNVVVEFIVESGNVTGYRQPGEGFYGTTFAKLSEEQC